jgi:hypothetical protein
MLAGIATIIAAIALSVAVIYAAALYAILSDDPALSVAVFCCSVYNCSLCYSL